MKEFLIIGSLFYLLVNNLSLELETFDPTINNALGLPYRYPLKNIFLKSKPGEQPVVNVRLTWNEQLSLLN